VSVLEVRLGRGLVDTDGVRHRDAVLVPPDGWLEAAVADAVDATGATPVLPATRHALLAACVERVGGYREPDAEVVAALSRGDLDQLALGLRRALLGSGLALVLRCANPACREEADVDLAVEDLLADADTPEPEWFVARAGDGTQVVLRAATGADDLAVAAAGGPPAARTATLMARLVRGVRQDDATAPGGPETRADDDVDLPVETPADWLALPTAQRTAALLALADVPTAPTTDLQVGCPACAAVIEVRLDPLVLLARELRAGGDRLLLETHCLAFHYGWSEEAILALPRHRRWGYLALLRAQVTGAPLETAVGGG
jgi:hypothetical protein